MRHYEHQLRKSSRKRRVSRVDLDEESETAVDSIRKVHKHKHRHKNKDIKQIVKNVNEEEISVTVGDENNVTISDPAPCIPADIPRQLTIQVIQPQQENSDSVNNNNNNNINNNNNNNNSNTKVKANNSKIEKTSDNSLMWMGGISAFFFLFKWEIVHSHHIAHLCGQILKICETKIILTITSPPGPSLRAEKLLPP